MRYKVEINTLSDLLVSDGDSFNSSVDLDVCYDELGIVYIPAKRIKGLIREACFDTDSNGLLELLGSNGDRDTCFFVSDARIKNYDEISEEISKNIKASNYQVADVRDYYTSLRSQTSIKNGVADDNSLRTMRQIRKGLVFEFEIKIESKKENDDIKKELEKSLKAIRHIGTSRTRGLGFVKFSLKGVIRDEKKTLDASKDKSDKLYKLDYSLYFEKPAIMINGDGNRAVSEDYIEGSKMLGAFIRQCKRYMTNDEAMALIDDNIIFSNLYISDCHDGARFVPVMNSLRHVKNSEMSGDNTVYDFTKYEEVKKDLEDVQVVSYKNKYANVLNNGNIKIMGVDKDITYHHRRSNKKGRTQDKDTSSFFQIESISEGQIFKGYIIGDERQIEAFKSAFSPEDRLSIGYSKTAQYGACIINYNNEEELSDKKSEGSELRFMHLLAPLVIYNDGFMVSSNAKDIKNYFPEGFEVRMDKSFISYKTVGGYNVTLKTNKPSLNLIDKGSLIAFEYNGTLDLNGFLGERNAEGFGEYNIYSKNDLKVKRELVKDKSQNIDDSVVLSNFDISKDILLERYINEKLGEVDEELKNLNNLRKLKMKSTQISQIIKLLNTYSSMDDVYIRLCLIANSDKRAKVFKVFFKNPKSEAFAKIMNAYERKYNGNNREELIVSLRDENKTVFAENRKLELNADFVSDFDYVANRYYSYLFKTMKYDLRK